MDKFLFLLYNNIIQYCENFVKRIIGKKYRRLHDMNRENINPSAALAAFFKDTPKSCEP